MSRYSRNNECCPFCGLRYADFRCSLRTKEEVYAQMFVHSEDSSKWRYKRKGSILGYWHMVKQREWQQHLNECYFDAIDVEPEFLKTWYDIIQEMQGIDY